MLRAMGAEEIFLSCSNLTLGQYKILVLSRGLTGAAGCVAALAILVIILVATRRKAWENLSKRVYISTIFSSFLYSAVAIAGVNYSHPPSQEAASWCAAMGFLLHYTGTLCLVHYGALAFIITFQVTVPLYQAVRKGTVRVTPKKAKLLEVLLFLSLFLCPLLITWEPFLPRLPPYGNYGPVCWFSLELTENCTADTSDVTFLQAVPYAVVCFVYFATVTVSLVILCGMYCKFRTTTIGSRISRVIPTVVVLAVISILLTTWFTYAGIPSQSVAEIQSFSSWLLNVTNTLAPATIVVPVVVGLYVYFPAHLCCCCTRASRLSTRNVQSQLSKHKTIRPSEVDHRNVPSSTASEIAHETVTTTETSRLIDERLQYHTFV